MQEVTTSSNHIVPHRKQLRLLGYDYKNVGSYFITICTENRRCLFEKVVDGEMIMNDVGKMIYEVWSGLPSRYPGVQMDFFVIMPNHIHAIVFLGAVDQGYKSDYTMISLSDLVRNFKTYTASRYSQGVKKNGWPNFSKRLWQRNYYEHIIRNENSLEKIQQYINENPMRWNDDEDNPKNGKVLGRTQRSAPTTEIKKIMLENLGVATVGADLCVRPVSNMKYRSL